MRALVVVNPAATATTPKMRDVLVRALASELKVDLAETAHRGHARELGERAVADGVDVVVTLGGDGTVNEVVNGLLAGGPRPGLPVLAVVPGGSTNVFSRALDRSRHPVDATAEILDALRAGRTRLVSLGTASAAVPPPRTAAPDGTAPGGTALDGTAPDGTAVAGPDGWTPERWFVFSAGLGFDAQVIGRVEERRAAGRRSTGALYVKEATTAFLFSRDRRRPAMTLHVPGARPVEDLFLCVVANVTPWTYLGSRPVQPTPQASFETGLDVFAMGRVGTTRMLRTVGQVLATRPDPHGRRLHGRHDLAEACVEAARPLPWQLDGDHLGTATALRVRGVPAALRVVA
jgi:diacylglycerol kinase family enzyme